MLFSCLEVFCSRLLLRNSVSSEEKESLCSISSARDKKPIFNTIIKIIAEPGNRGFEGINPLSVVPIIVLAFFTHQRCVYLTLQQKKYT